MAQEKEKQERVKKFEHLKNWRAGKKWGGGGVKGEGREQWGFGCDESVHCK